ncbi:MAG: hypothetical protein M1582_04585 [Actinobacteria bacterium]|nr:hypothetical protein [Actinomycetota bacterium]
MEDHRRILLYGGTLILDSVGAALRKWPELEVISLSPPLPGFAELESLVPDAILFDVETPHPDAVFSLLETRPGLVLLGISPHGNVVRLWSGRQLRELSSKDLKDVIEQQLGMRSTSRRAGRRNEDTR